MNESLLKLSAEYEVMKVRMKRAFKSKKGSPTMEYVIIIGIGAVFAGLLGWVFTDDGAATNIKDAFKDKVMKIFE
ncbi:hypothetical protein [Baia soyae]|uniref:Uncharacterized protein n=1 Tax=Baia soyae TaxID=1544746 RepID=A0A4R2S9X4_9BACL|nr:hypothetical protein [Baia soyae]TCP69236.1 hypothetical protein EDD57_11133 [Baia soyae]